jgi:LysM repeat protein
MKNKRFLIFILAILLAFGLAACERPASQPSTSSEDEASVPLPTMGTQEPMDMLEEMATQTALAQEAGAQQPEADASEGEAAAAEGTAEEAAPEEGTAPEEGEESAPAEAETSEGDDTEAGGGQEPGTVPQDYEVPNTYTLHSGEFPYCIARRFNISPSALLSANGLSLNSNVYPGTKLTIPKEGGSYDAGSRALRSHPTDYKIVAGDTVFSIACLFGDVDPRAIEAVNGLSGSYTLTPGTVIKIP